MISPLHELLNAVAVAWIGAAIDATVSSLMPPTATCQRYTQVGDEAAQPGRCMRSQCSGTGSKLPTARGNDPIKTSARDQDSYRSRSAVLRNNLVACAPGSIVHSGANIHFSSVAKLLNLSMHTTCNRKNCCGLRKPNSPPRPSFPTMAGFVNSRAVALAGSDPNHHKYGTSSDPQRQQCRSADLSKVGSIVPLSKNDVQLPEFRHSLSATKIGCRASRHPRQYELYGGLHCCAVAKSNGSRQ